MMEEILRSLADYSFSVIIAIYLLVRMEKKIENLTNSINELNNNIKK